MFLLINVVEQIEKLPEILEGFSSVGVRGTTILGTTGMGRVLMARGAELPAAEETAQVLQSLQPSNRTTLTVVANQQLLDAAIKVIKDSCGDLNQPGKGIIAVVPLHFVDGVS
jgi:nitrogen regulatory protein PII